MTYSGGLIAEPMDSPASDYPTLFGITFTPKVSGILAAIAGLGLAVYLGNLFISPALETSGQLQESIDQKEETLQRKQETIQQLRQVITNLNRAKAQNAEVRALFSSQQALDTLLLDLNRVIVGSNAQLLSFNPDYAASGTVTDGSLGPELNNKLKRQVTAVSFQGTFNQTLDIMRAIDRLQTVLVVRDLTLGLQESNQPGAPSNLVTSTFKLYAYVPLTPEEIAAAAKAQAAAAKAKPEDQKSGQ